MIKNFSRASRFAYGTLALVALLSVPVAVSAATKLKVAYIPIMPMSQLYVMEGEGWTK